MAAQNPNIKFIFGIILIVCGWVICFDLFLLIFGIPFFLLGTILVLFSKKSLLVKVITVGLPIVLWFVGFQLILHEISKKTAITVVIPENFSGQARVVYGEKGGIIPPRDEDGRMVLNIPKNGILIIQPHLESGIFDVKYFCSDSSGKWMRINELKNPADKKIKRPAVLIEQGQSSEGNELDYIYDGFFVFANDSSKYETFQEEMKHNPLTDSLVKVSRGIK